MPRKFFTRVPRTSRVNHIGRPGGRTGANQRQRGLEALESRQMLSAAIASPAGPTLAQAAVIKSLAVTPEPDLTIQFAGTLPAAAVSGSGAKFVLPVSVTNQGAAPTPSGAVTAIDIYARPVGAADSSQDVLIGSLPTARLGKLAVGGSKLINISVSFPLYLPTGSYDAVAVVNADNSIVESNVANNSAIDPTPISITAGQVDLVAGKVTSGIRLNDFGNTVGFVHITVSNAGDVSLPQGQDIDIALYARPIGAVDNSGDILLTVHGVSVSGLKAGRSETFEVFISSIPADVTTGQYSIVAVVDSTNVVTETNENNNTGVSTDIVTLTPSSTGGGGGSGGQSQPVDLAITGGTMTFSSAAAPGATGTATIDFSNAGQTTATGTFTISVYAVGVTDQDQPALLVGVSAAEAFDLASDAAGAPVTVSLTLPSPTTATTYELVAEIMPAAADTNPANNNLDIGAVAVSASSGGGSILGSLPATITFTQIGTPVVGTFTTSSGTFTGIGGSGTYTWLANTSGSAADQGTLTLTPAGSSTVVPSLVLTQTTGAVPTLLNGRSLTLSTSSTDTQGAVDASLPPLGTLEPIGFFDIN